MTGRSESKPTAAVVLDTRRQKISGAFPLRLRVTFQRERKYYTIKLDDLDTQEWDKLKNSDRLKDKRLLSIRDKIAEYEKLAKDVFKIIPRFSFDRFEERYFSDHSIDVKSQADNVFAAFTEQAKKLRLQGRVSTASSYETAANSLKAYKSHLRFSDLTPALLEEYEEGLIKAGKSVTTVGIYLRNLRTLVNAAKAKGTITSIEYPFGKGRYEIPAARNIKKALTLSEIEKIYNYPTQIGTPADRAKDLWLFSYLCNGINMKDICRLRWRDIDNNQIMFVRAKTARTKKSNLKPVVAALTSDTKSIIEKHTSLDRSPDAYIFPILFPGVSPQRERELVQYLTRSVNKYMNRIAVALEISKPVTTYTARHSFATVLKRSGVSNEFISEALAHSSLRTTDSYIDSTTDGNDLQMFANKLLGFKTN